MMRRSLAGLLAVALLGACATSPTGRSQLLLVSPEAAIVESQRAYAATLRDLGTDDKFLDDPLLADRVARITGRLVGQAVAMFPHTRDWDWSVALIDEPETVNAWCMPGGKMALYSGFVSQLDPTDDELAQLLGHKISHAVADHGAERMSMAILQGLGVLAVGAATDDAATTHTAQLLATLALRLPNSRAAESEADRIGIELAARAGYDPAAGASLWRKMERVGGGGRLEFLSTHPSPGNRGQALAAIAPTMRPLLPATPPPPHPVKVLPTQRHAR